MWTRRRSPRTDSRPVGETLATLPHLVKSCSTAVVVLVCLASAAGGQDQPRASDTTTKRAQSTIAQMKAAQTALPIDPQERIADDSDSAAAKMVLGDIYRDEGGLWKAMHRSANPGVRAHLIEMIATSGVAAPAIAHQLPIASDAGERAALIRALGGFTERQLSQNERESVAATLLQLYRNDPDAEVHSSIAWLLGSPESDTAQHRVDWKQMSAIDALDSALQRKTPMGGPGWSVSVMGYTMIAIRPTTPFMMGAPLSEVRREPNELPHKVQIPRAFAIASKEVSVAQFQQFLSETGRREAWLKATRERWPNNPDPGKFMSDPRRPQFAVTWYEAAQYCNWLSGKAGIPKDQWVYPDSIGPGMNLPGNYLHRTGYRLPTEAEWEFAARAGTSSAHFFGEGVALLDRYAWYFVNADLHGWPVGTKEPNQFGLFDMYGNAWEWVNDRWIDYPDRGMISSDIQDTALVITDDSPRVRRGGSWSYDKETTRSAHRGSPGGYRPPDRRDSVGFRVAQTIK